MFLKRIFILISFIFLLNIAILSNNINNDDLIADKIHNILIEEYDKYENTTLEERMILKFGRKAFFESVNIWRENYKNIENIKITLHPQLEKMAKIVDQRLPQENSSHFREMLTELTFLSYKNLQLYFIAVKEYLIVNKLTPDNIVKETIDKSIAMPKFFYQKMEMYDREEFLKNQIRKTIRDERVKIRLSFYAFAFDFFNKIRKKIIAKDIERMKEMMNKKNTNPL